MQIIKMVALNLRNLEVSKILEFFDDFGGGSVLGDFYISIYKNEKELEKFNNLEIEKFTIIEK